MFPRNGVQEASSSNLDTRTKEAEETLVSSASFFIVAFRTRTKKDQKLCVSGLFLLLKMWDFAGFCVRCDEVAKRTRGLLYVTLHQLPYRDPFYDHQNDHQYSRSSKDA